MTITSIGRADQVVPAGGVRQVPGMENQEGVDRLPFLVPSALLDVASAGSTHILVPFKGTIIEAHMNLVSQLASGEGATMQFGTQGKNTKYGTVSLSDSTSTGLMSVLGDIGTTTVDAGDIVRLASDGNASTSKNIALLLTVAPTA